MRSYSLTSLSDAALLRDLAALIAHDRVTMAAILAHIAEVDARRLYVPAGYPSMHAYCVGELRLSEDAAFRRIRAARAGREFPTLFAGLAQGRINLAGICLLAPHLTRENAGELIEAATHRRKAEIEEMLARRLPSSEVSASLQAVPAMASELPQLVPGRVGTVAVVSVGNLDEHSPANVDASPVEAAPPSFENFLLKLTIGKSTREKLRYAQALLSHAIPTGDVAQVLDRALDALIVELEKRKLGTGIRRQPRQHSRPRLPSRRDATGRSRYIPAWVRRAVWERDRGQCTFVSAAGHRCESRRFLEFDHIDPVARGGREARRAAGEARGRVPCNMPRGMLERTDTRERTALEKERAAGEHLRDVLAGLHNLGCRADQARRAAAIAANLQGATLEERMRAALTSLGRR